jgi:hypothetical protein
MKDGKQYRQPRDTVNRLYIPKTLDATILLDPRVDLYFAEGEKKAIKMVQEGLPAIAATGINSWLRNGQPIPDLDAITWEGRSVTIVFDSDPGTRSKGNVDKARRWLAAELTIRGASVKAVILPDDGKTKVGVDDYLVTQSVQDFLALPRQSVPVSSPITNSTGRSGDHYVTEAVEKLIWNRLLKKSSDDSGSVPEFDVPLRTVLNRGMRPEHLTARVKSKNGCDPRVKIGKATYPYVIVYYNLLRAGRHTKGRYSMTMPRGKDIPVWQALMELDAGEVELPGEYGPQDVPTSAPKFAADVLAAWLKTLGARHRKYPSCPGVFDPEMISLMVGTSRGVVQAAWEWLALYGYVDAVWEKDAKGELPEFYRPGTDPLDPGTFDLRYEDEAPGRAKVIG